MDDDEAPGKEWQDGKTRPRCKGPRRNGERCTKEELPDLGYCFSHAPDELIEQAERLTGLTRCRHVVSSVDEEGKPHAHTGQRCGNVASGGYCNRHGGTLPSVKRAAFEDILNRRAEVELAAVTAIEQKTDMVLRARPAVPVTNPFLELLELAGEIKAFKDKIGTRIDAMRAEEFRYEHERAGEQIHGLILIYIRVIERLETCLSRIVKLGIEEKMMRITERQQEIIEQAFLRTLADPKFDLAPAVQREMKDAVVRRLRVA